MACNRPLTTPAVSVQTRGGVLALGPVCARRKGLLRPAKPRFLSALVARTADDDQFQLFEVTA